MGVVGKIEVDFQNLASAELLRETETFLPVMTECGRQQGNPASKRGAAW